MPPNAALGAITNRAATWDQTAPLPIVLINETVAPTATTRATAIPWTTGARRASNAAT